MKKHFFILFFILAAALPLLPASAAGEGRDIVILGDSNSWLGGDDCDIPRGWSKWFKESSGIADCHSYARSGATWTNSPETKGLFNEYSEVLSPENVIFNQFQRLKYDVDAGMRKAPDIILILCGTNDGWFCDRFPGMFLPASAISDEELVLKDPGDVTTLAESIKYSCLKLRNEFPETQIVLLTPMQNTKAKKENMQRVVDTITAVAEALKISCVRLDGPDIIDSERERRGFSRTYDGVHASESGAKVIAKRVAEEISNFTR